MKYYQIYATGFNSFSVEVHNNDNHYVVTKLTTHNLCELVDLLWELGFEDQTEPAETDFE